MYRTCFRCLNMKVSRMKRGLVAVTCRAASRHSSLGLISVKNRKVFSGTCAFRFCSNDHIAKVDSGNEADRRELRTFNEIVSLRRKQASKSLLIEAPSKGHLENIYEICEKFGTVEAVFNYSQASGKEIFLVECATLEMQQELMKYCHYPSETTGLPVHSRLLYLPENINEFQATYGATLEEAVKQEIVPCDTVSEQMERFYRIERLQDLGTRLRFFICQLVEESIGGLFPFAEVLPFGSSINGFGRNNCDLDMTLCFNATQARVDSKLCFFARKQLLSERRQCQQNLEAIGEVIRAFFPGVENVNKILRARIPIVEFYHCVTGIDCDLSLTNKCAFYMGELLHLYGDLDSRVRPLVFTIRHWAKIIGLTQPVAGPWISNFTLTLLVLFFLQNRPEPILPSIQSLIKLADADDHKTADGIDCTFQRKVWKIPKTGNTEDTGDLLSEFFIFYEKFNFSKYGMSIFAGKAIIKPDNSIVYLENPLERRLNVGCNVGINEVDRLREYARWALWKMESDADKSSGHWGIEKLFEKNSTESSGVNRVNNSHKGAFTVGPLFGESSSSPLHYVVTAVSKKKKDGGEPVGNKERAVTSESEKSRTKSNSKNVKMQVGKETKSRNRRKPVMWEKW